MEDRAISQDEIEMQQEYDLQKKLGLSDEEWEYGCGDFIATYDVINIIKEYCEVNE